GHRGKSSDHEPSARSRSAGSKTWLAWRLLVTGRNAGASGNWESIVTGKRREERKKGRRQKAKGRQQKAESRKQKAAVSKGGQFLLLTPVYCLLPTAFCFLPWAGRHGSADNPRGPSTPSSA